MKPSYFTILTLVLATLLAPARADILYVGNTGNNTIEKFTSDGVGSVFANYDSGVRAPSGLAFDNAGNLYVGSHSGYGDAIQKYSPDGVVSVFSTYGLTYPQGLSFDPAGNLYAAHNVINKITAGGIGSLFGNGAPNPQGIAFDRAGNLYVSSINNSTVERFSPTGVYLGAFVTSGLYRPYGLAFDKAGNLYVADLLYEKIEKITPSGGHSVFASAGLSHPYGLAFDSAENLYVSNYSNDTIMKFTPNGVGSVFASGLSDPEYLAFTDDAGVPLPLANGYPTPEPTSAMLVALGLPTLLAFRRRRSA